jgi:hypothetical protein
MCSTHEFRSFEVFSGFQKRGGSCANVARVAPIFFEIRGWAFHLALNNEVGMS